jgi:hypothetical protein
MPIVPSPSFAVAASSLPSPLTSPSTTTHTAPPQSRGVDAVNVPLPFPSIVTICSPFRPPTTTSVMPSPFMSRPPGRTRRSRRPRRTWHAEVPVPSFR